jgi:hypothetical protein
MCKRLRLMGRGRSLLVRKWFVLLRSPLAAAEVRAAGRLPVAPVVEVPAVEAVVLLLRTFRLLCWVELLL